MDLKNISSDKFEQIFCAMVDGKIAKDEAKKILLEINEIGFSCDIFLAAIKVLKDRMKKVKAPAGAIDLCGTGGDKLNTLNVSTATSFVVAACGVVVAKHGNKAISSKSGSADIFSELGIKPVAEIAKIEETLQKHKLCFLFAPFFHESLKNLAQIRTEIAQEFQVPTIFNYLGPLLNPANAKLQMIGVSRYSVMQPMAEALQKMGSKKAFLVHGFDKMDEITICDKSYILKLEDNQIKDEEIINPTDFGFEIASIEKIKGQDPKYNAAKLLQLLQGEESEYLDIVLLNSAFALVLAGKERDIASAVKTAKNAIKSGAALELLSALKAA